MLDLVVAVLLLELTMDLEELRPVDDLVPDPNEDVDVLTVLCTLVGIVLVIDLVDVDTDGKVDVERIVLVRDAAVEIPVD